MTDLDLTDLDLAEWHQHVADAWLAPDPDDTEQPCDARAGHTGPWRHDCTLPTGHTGQHDYTRLTDTRSQ